MSPTSKVLGLGSCRLGMKQTERCLGGPHSYHVGVGTVP